MIKEFIANLKEMKTEIHTRYMVNRILGKSIINSIKGAIANEYRYRVKGER